MKLLTLLTVLSFCCTASAGDDAGIQALFQNRSDAWEKQDVAQLVGAFDEDADYIGSSGVHVSGKKAIEEYYRSLFASADFSADKSIQKITRIRFLQPDIALIDAEWAVSGVKSLQGEAQPGRSGSTVMVVIKKGNDWKIAALRITRRENM